MTAAGIRRNLRQRRVDQFADTPNMIRNAGYYRWRLPTHFVLHRVLAVLTSDRRPFGNCQETLM